MKRIKPKMHASETSSAGYFIQARARGLEPKNFGHTLAVLGYTRKEAFAIFFNRFKFEQHMADGRARRNAAECLRDQYDPHAQNAKKKFRV